MFSEKMNRRHLMKLAAAGVCGVSASNWLDVLAAARSPNNKPAPRTASSCGWTAAQRTRTPSIFVPAPIKAARSAEFRPRVNGIQISEHFPQFARLTNHAAIIRSMSTAGRGSRPGQAITCTPAIAKARAGSSIPSIGSIAAKELGDENAALPNFVSDRPIAATVLASSGPPPAAGRQRSARGVENLRTGLAAEPVR